jgi:MoaA/NifB/PqqE/SkfB family radical SAM enzyme
MLHKQIKDIIKYCTDNKLASNIITTGVLPSDKYSELFDVGLNQLQFSCHHIGDKFDEIVELPGAYVKQRKVIDWCKSNGKPFRTNTTLQQLNYRDLEIIVANLIEQKPFHISLLGFLPHYQWKEYAQDVIVHPEELRPHIEKASKMVIDAGILLTIRYHPFCHLDKKYWPYVTNALYVPQDPMEWFYEKYTPNVEEAWSIGLRLAEVGVKGRPCNQCEARIHCGGWNQTSVSALNGAGLCAITGLKDNEKVRGYYFDQNPTNSHSGVV